MPDIDAPARWSHRAHRRRDQRGRARAWRRPSRPPARASSRSAPTRSACGRCGTPCPGCSPASATSPISRPSPTSPRTLPGGAVRRRFRPDRRADPPGRRLARRRRPRRPDRRGLGLPARPHRHHAAQHDPRVQRRPAGLAGRPSGHRLLGLRRQARRPAAPTTRQRRPRPRPGPRRRERLREVWTVGTRPRSSSCAPSTGSKASWPIAVVDLWDAQEHPPHFTGSC